MATWWVQVRDGTGVNVEADSVALKDERLIFTNSKGGVVYSFKTWDWYRRNEQD